MTTISLLLPDRRRVARACAATSLVIGMLVFGEGAWMFTKARVAQVLLEMSWRRLGAMRPWPWADTRPVAKLTIDGETIIVLSGVSGRTMAFGPGHMDGSATPGSEGNCVITAHRDTHFASLRYVIPGDDITLQKPDGAVVHYEVVETMVVDKDDTRSIAPTDDTRLTLITCYPFDSILPGGPLRWVVVAVKAA